MTLTSLTLPDKTLAVVKETSSGAATNRKQEVTQYALPLRWGCLAIIAHNYLEGGRFGSLKLGDTVSVVDDGVEKAFTVIEIKRYQALTANSPTSKFVDQDSKQTISYAEVFRRHYETPGRLTLQTCISQGASSSWGRLFVICAEKETGMGYLYLPTRIPYPITQVFGVNPGAYSGFGLAGHNGVDYGTPVGTPLYACRDGVIERVRTDTTGYGRHIKIEHDNCWTIYGHMSRVDVVVGQTVTAKQLVGLSGGAKSDPYAGNSTGPHLHFEVRPKPAVSNAYGGAVDPLPLLIHWEADMTNNTVLWRGKVNTAGLNVRSGPSTSYPRIDGLAKDTVVEVIQEKDNWLRLNRIVDSWVYAPYVTKIEDVTPNPDPCPDTSAQKSRILSIADELRGIADTL